MKDKQNIINLYLKSVEKFNELQSIPKDFGTGDLLYSSEIHTLVAIGDVPGCNLTELAAHMDITKGGAAKFVKKLMMKGLIVKERLPNNRKETIYRLTETGAMAYEGHKEYSRNMFGEIIDLLESMSLEEQTVLETFLGQLNQVINRR